MKKPGNKYIINIVNDIKNNIVNIIGIINTVINDIYDDAPPSFQAFIV